MRSFTDFLYFFSFSWGGEGRGGFVICCNEATPLTIKPGYEGKGLTRASPLYTDMRPDRTSSSCETGLSVYLPLVRPDCPYIFLL